MICPLGMLKDKSVLCSNKNCGIWDSEHNQCGLLTYMTAGANNNKVLASLYQKLQKMDGDD